MTSAVKRAVIGFCVAFGNMFLAHGIFFGWMALFNFLNNFDNIVRMLIPTVILLYVLQLALNIVLYFTVLKKQFEPVKDRKPLFYFLLAATAGAVWTGAYFVFKALVWNNIIDYELFMNSYPEAMLGLQPLLLMIIIAFSVIYYTFFRKRVGELFYFYTLSILLVATTPVLLAATLVSTGE